MRFGCDVELKKGTYTSLSQARVRLVLGTLNLSVGILPTLNEFSNECQDSCFVLSFWLPFCPITTSRMDNNVITTIVVVIIVAVAIVVIPVVVAIVITVVVTVVFTVVVAVIVTVVVAVIIITTSRSAVVILVVGAGLASTGRFLWTKTCAVAIAAP